MATVIGAVLEATLPEVTRGVGVALPALRALTLQGTPLAGAALQASALGGVAESLPRLSANEIMRQLRVMGLPVRRQSALQAIKALRSQVDAYSNILNLTPGRIPLQSMIPYAGSRQRLKYQYTVQITGTDAMTGELRTQFIRINNPSLITKNQAMALAADTVLGNEQYQMSEITDAAVTLVTRQNPRIAND